MDHLSFRSASVAELVAEVCSGPDRESWDKNGGPPYKCDEAAWNDYVIPAHEADRIARAPHYLYVAFDDQQCPLYVGRTGNLRQRFTSHRQSSALGWFKRTWFVQLIGPMTLENAKTRELELILAWRPEQNYVSPRREPRPPIVFDAQNNTQTA